MAAICLGLNVLMPQPEKYLFKKYFTFEALF